MWRECVLRAAGFPIDGLEPLAAPAYARAADELAAARQGGASSNAEVARLETELRDAAELALMQEAAALRGIAADPLFREAVTWQNRDARRWATDPYAATTAGVKRNNEYRQRESTVIRYWQRYCAKNDTIGFFGPVCWATIVDAGEAVDVEPGPTLLRERSVYRERPARPDVPRASPTPTGASATASTGCSASTSSGPTT
ncbi:MAG TPA: lantibiotic dehydratase [Acidimicrobiales bacterium]|nr:lantibiotic dehydratase [Acidimicrobiales bacterium]